MKVMQEFLVLAKRIHTCTTLHLWYVIWNTPTMRKSLGMDAKTWKNVSRRSIAG